MSDGDGPIVRQHASLMTLDFNEDTETFTITTICSACAGFAPIIVPPAHLAALAVTLVAACHALDIDTATAAGTVLPFATAAGRDAAVAAYGKYVKDRRAAATDDEDHN